MSQNTRAWRFKTLLTLFLVALAVYILVPSVFDFNKRFEKKQPDSQEQAKESELPVKKPKKNWVDEVFLADPIKLGLDLRGGSRIQLDPDLQSVTERKLDFYVGTIQRYFDENYKKELKLQTKHQTGTHFIEVAVSKGELSQANRRLIDHNWDPEFSGQIFEITTQNQDADVKEVQEQTTSDNNKPEDPAKQNREEKPLDQEASQENKDQEEAAAKTQTELPRNSSVLRVKFTEDYAQFIQLEALKVAKERITNRIDRYGLVEPAVYIGNNRLIVEIPELQDTKQIVELIQRTGVLQFRIVDESIPTQTLKQWISEIPEQETKDIEPFSLDLARFYNKKLIDRLPSDAEIVFQLTMSTTSKSREVTEWTPYLIKKETPVDGQMLDESRAGLCAKEGLNINEPCVYLYFDSEGAWAFDDMASKNQGKQLAIVLEGFLHSAPVLQATNYNGTATITFNGIGDQMEEAKELTLILKEGSVPVELNVVDNKVIGPTLGLLSIQQGLFSLLVAALVILVFMIIYYKWGGLIATVALVMNVLFIFALLALFGAALTLPGMAGIVLTLGMAVDANIIIFERMKEEKRLGRPVDIIITQGYANARSAIIDANITTLIAAFFLFQFGTGSIKGFATTLMIGVVTTLFTAVFVTHFVYDYLVYRKKIKKVII